MLVFPYYTNRCNSILSEQADKHTPHLRVTSRLYDCSGLLLLDGIQYTDGCEWIDNSIGTLFKADSIIELDAEGGISDTVLGIRASLGILGWSLVNAGKGHSLANKAPG